MSDLVQPEESSDALSVHPGYGDGGVPWYLLLIYLSFLVFFTWYVLEYQLPDFLNQGPGQLNAPEKAG